MGHEEKKLWVPMRNQTLDLWISRFDSLPVSYGELDELDGKLGRNNIKF